MEKSSLPQIKLGKECSTKLEPLMEVVQDLVAAKHFWNIDQKPRADSMRISAMGRLDDVERLSGDHVDKKWLSNLKEGLQEIGEKQGVMGDVTIYAKYSNTQWELLLMLLNAAVDCECREAKTAFDKLGSAAMQTVLEEKPGDYRPRSLTEITAETTGESEKTVEDLEEEAEELKGRIRAKYPMEVPQPWPEELQEWQGRLWYIGDLIIKRKRSGGNG